MKLSQEKLMELLAGTPKPPADMAWTLKSLAEATGLPSRIIVGIDTYVKAAHKAAKDADVAKLSQKSAQELWELVRTESRRLDDIVDHIEAEMAAAAARKAGTDSGAEANPTAADPTLDFITSKHPLAVDFFTQSRTKEELNDYLNSLPTISNASDVATLAVLLAACFDLIKNRMVEGVESLVVALLDQYLSGCGTPGDEGVRAKKYLVESCRAKGLDAPAVLKSIAPKVLDLFQGLGAPSDVSDGDLVLGLGVWLFWDSTICNPLTGAAISAEAQRRKASPVVEPTTHQSAEVTARESAAKNDQKKEPLRGLERAAQEGRRNWNLEGKHATAYNKPAYREAYDRGWTDCQRAYDSGREAAQSENGSPGNPYHGADPDNALAHAYELGVTSVHSPQSISDFGNQTKDGDDDDDE